MANKDVVLPQGMEPLYENWHFAPAIRDRDRLYASGQIGFDAEGKVSPDPEAQFTQAFENVKLVLDAAGLGFEDVVEMTTFHVGLQSHIAVFGQVKDRYLKKPYPAWTAIGITELALPGALVEIKVIARARD